MDGESCRIPRTYFEWNKYNIMGRCSGESLDCSAANVLALLERAPSAMANILAQQPIDYILPYLGDGIRIGGVAGGLLLGWRIYTAAANNGLEQERASQERLEEELNAFRKRAEADYAKVVARLEHAEKRLTECHRESAELMKEFQVLKAQIINQGDPNE